MENEILKDAACMIILNPETGKVLSVSRKNDHDDKNLIGGKVDDEDYIEGPKVNLTGVEFAAKRETREETGLIVTNMIQVFCRKARTRLVTTYLALAWHGEIKSSEEGVVEWVDLDDLFQGTYGPYNKLLVRELFKLIANLDVETLKKLKSNLVMPIDNETK